MRTIKIITCLLFLLSSIEGNAQDSTDSSFYFPYKTGDMWEYLLADGIYSDTLQNFNVKDSIDTNGNIHFRQSAKFINPPEPPLVLPYSSDFIIDTALNVYAWRAFADTIVLIYKLNAKQGDQWVMWTYGDSNEVVGYEMCRVSVTEENIFGKMRTRKAFVYYYSQDSTDTLGLERYGHVLIDGIGLYFSGGGDAIGDIYFRGAVIDGIFYGDTTLVTSVKDRGNNLPNQFELYPNYPNPFNPITTLSFMLKNSVEVSLIIYDMIGREVIHLIDKEWLESGNHKIIWNGRNHSGLTVTSGVYYFQLVIGNKKLTRSMTVLK